MSRMDHHRKRLAKRVGPTPIYRIGQVLGTVAARVVVRVGYGLAYAVAVLRERDDAGRDDGGHQEPRE